jgi:hypothetical protein
VSRGSLLPHPRPLFPLIGVWALAARPNPISDSMGRPPRPPHRALERDVSLSMDTSSPITLQRATKVVHPAASAPLPYEPPRPAAPIHRWLSACAEACERCAQVCAGAAADFQSRPRKPAHRVFAEMDEVVVSCRTTAAMIRRGTRYASQASREASLLCQSLATALIGYDREDEFARSCVEACSEVVETCRVVGEREAEQARLAEQMAG